MSDRYPLSPPARPDDSNAAAVEALRDELRELPNLAAPPAVWTNVIACVDRAARRRRRRLPVALAASALLACTATIAFLASSPQAPSVNAAPASELAALLEHSRRLEEGRRAIPPLPPSGTELVLRARIGGIDASLNDQLLQEATLSFDRRERLLRERVDLMESLMHIERDRHRELVRQAVF